VKLNKIIKKQDELIKALKSFVPDLQNDVVNKLKSELSILKDKPSWCPHSNCLYELQSQDKMCIGKLSELKQHGNDFNTHRLCIDTRETGHGIFDLQINWSDAYNLMRLLKTIKDK